MNNMKKSETKSKSEVASSLEKQSKLKTKKSQIDNKYGPKIIKVSTESLSTEVDKIRNSSTSSKKSIKNNSTPSQTPLQAKAAQIFKNKKCYLSNKSLSYTNSSKEMIFTHQKNDLLQTQQRPPEKNEKIEKVDLLSKFTSIVSNLTNTNSLKIPLELHEKKASLCLNNFKNQTITKSFNLPNLDEVDNKKIINLSTTSNNTSLIAPKGFTKNLSNLNGSNNRSINTTNINISFINKEKGTKDIFKVLENKLEDLLNTCESLDEKKSFYVSLIKLTSY